MNHNQDFKFLNIPSKKNRDRIIKLLSYCKEIRETSYPMKNSLVTELKLIEFTARKEEKDMYFITGTLLLEDGELFEKRTFEAYIMDYSLKTNIYLDITRINVQDEPKMIRTSEKLVENEDNITSITSYATNDQEKNNKYSHRFRKNSQDSFIFQENLQQLSVL